MKNKLLIATLCLSVAFATGCSCNVQNNETVSSDETREQIEEETTTTLETEQEETTEMEFVPSPQRPDWPTEDENPTEETTEEAPEETSTEMESLQDETPIETQPETAPETEPETLPEFTVEPLSQVMWAKSGVNVRDYPSTDGEKIGGLSTAQPVNVTGKASTGWWQVEYNGKVGYVSRSYLLDHEPQPEPQPAPQAPAANTSASDQQLSSIISFADGVPQETINAAYKYWSMIPEATRNKIVNSGYRIDVLNTRYVPYEGRGDVVGLTSYRDKNVTLGNAEKHMRRSLVHELGHVLDDVYNFPSQSQEWKKIWESERFQMQIQEKYDDHPIENTREFFAECVEQYVQYNSILNQTCPKAYSFISKYVY